MPESAPAAAQRPHSSLPCVHPIAVITTDEQDRIRIIRLVDPELVPDADLTFDIVVGVNTRGDLAYIADTTLGLTGHAGRWTALRACTDDAARGRDSDLGVTAFAEGAR